MGTVLGTIGRWLGGEAAGGAAFYLVGLLGLLLAAREWGWIDFRLPERKLQTERLWVHEFGFVTASAMWGLHIGLGFATRVTYGGFWVLVAIALALGDPIYGAMLMLVYWLGRALPVWLAPALLKSGSDTNQLLDMVSDHRLVYHRTVGITLVWSAVVIVLLALPTK
jgi:cytochrome c biogenesis protein CcdA